MPKHAREDDEVEIEANDAPPTEINPYHVLDLPVDASEQEIKKAYRKAALRHHPDKAAPEDKQAAHTKFQEIAFAFAILSDERRRKRYDTTGRTEESLDLGDDDFDWTAFFREQFQSVTEESINKFSDEYKGSEEERGHVLDAYVKTKGKMESLYTRVMLSDMLDDEDRFRTIIDKAIEAGEVESFKPYVEETDRARAKRMERARKRKEKEAGEAEEVSKEIRERSTAKKRNKTKGDGELGDLAALIQRRQQGRAENFFDNLEAKYAAEGKKGDKVAKMGEPSEEAFAANRKHGKGGDAIEEARKSKRAKK